MTTGRFTWALIFLIGCARSEPPAEALPTVTPMAKLSSPAAKVTDKSQPPTPSGAATLLYLEREAGGGQSTARLPWVLAFHGLGDRAASFGRLFEGLTTPSHLYLVQAPAPYGRGYDWFGVRASGDPKLLAKAMRRAAAQVLGVITKLQQDPKNLGKPVVTGFSQGGMLSFALAALHSNKIAASLPLSGWLPPPLLPSKLPSQAAPLWVFHGQDDSVVPWQPTAQLSEQLKLLGFAVTTRSYPGLGHSLNSELRKDWKQALSKALHSTAISSLSSWKAAHPSTPPGPTPTRGQ